MIRLRWALSAIRARTYAILVFLSMETKYKFQNQRSDSSKIVFPKTKILDPQKLNYYLFHILLPHITQLEE